MSDDQQSIQNSLTFLIYQTALALKSSLQRSFKENGHEITAEQWGIMRHLWEEEGLSQREIGARASKDKPNITRMLDSLEKKRLILRQPDPRDRRKFRVYLTPEGKLLHERLFPLVNSLREQVTRQLSQSEIDFLKEILSKINPNIGNR